MNKQITGIIRGIVHREEKYYLEKHYIRWGLVEKEINAVLEAELAKRDKVVEAARGVVNHYDKYFSDPPLVVEKLNKALAELDGE